MFGGNCVTPPSYYGKRRGDTSAEQERQLETEKHIYRVEVSFQVDIVASEELEAMNEAYDAFMRGDYNPTPNGGTVADIHTQVWEVLEMDEDDLA